MENSTVSVEDIKDCCTGATYITLNDAVKLHWANKQQQGHVVQREVKGNVVVEHYTPSWPSVAIHIHPANSWGSDFPLLPNL